MYEIELNEEERNQLLIVMLSLTTDTEQSIEDRLTYGNIMKKIIMGGTNERTSDFNSNNEILENDTNNTCTTIDNNGEWNNSINYW